MTAVGYPTEYEHIFAVLEHLGLKPGYDRWDFLCPVHDDNRHSATARIGDDGLLLKCHAAHGCTFEEILSCLQDIAGKKLCCRPYNGKNPDYWRKRMAEDAPVLEREDIYKDEQGNPEFREQKFRLHNLKKDFKQHAAVKGSPGQWRPTMEGARRILYGLPELLANQELPADKRRGVLIVEGPRKAADLRDIGLLATTASGGACKFHLSIEHCSCLRDCDIVILPDHDPVDPKTGRRAGWEHAMQTANLLKGFAKRIRILMLPMEEGMDPSDWLATVPGDAKAKKMALWELIQKAPDFDPLAMGCPLPPALARIYQELTENRKIVIGRFMSMEDALGHLDVDIHTLRGALAYAKVTGEKTSVARDKVVRMLAQIGADAMRALEDLQLLEPEG